jgi:hypothetical protein
MQIKPTTPQEFLITLGRMLLGEIYRTFNPPTHRRNGDIHGSLSLCLSNKLNITARLADDIANKLIGGKNIRPALLTIIAKRWLRKESNKRGNYVTIRRVIKILQVTPKDLRHIVSQPLVQ